MSRKREMISNRTDMLKAETTLSDREAEAVAHKSAGMSAAAIADEMGIETSTVNEYIKRARTKARDGFDTYDELRRFGLVDDRE